MSNIVLDTRFVGDIEGMFYLPDYQRGYRWTKEEIRLLLDDIYENGDKPYCLQPIVVKPVGDRYELIDGQQRLTTLFLIYKYLEKTLNNPLYAPPFQLSYETREKSGKFLETLAPERAEENIDFYFISRAYKTIQDYFTLDSEGNPKKLKAGVLTKLNEYLEEKVSVIWYEVDSGENGIELFERLNIGKIPLTSSELVKALFLRESATGELSGRQEEIALQWDAMEHSLRDSSFWSFLTNTEAAEYPTRIDLLLDLMAYDGSDGKNPEKYHTFFYFDKKIKERRASDRDIALKEIWGEIYHVFLTLREWYHDHDFYHKIGYLIASGASTLNDIFEIWKGEGDVPLCKDRFMEHLDRLIRESIRIPDTDTLKDLSYETDQAQIRNLLLLFNIETERLMDERKRRFPFDKHKEGAWSLEHIHAQHSEGLTTNDKIKTWLEAHARLLRSGALGEDRGELLHEMETLIRNIESEKTPLQVRKRFDEIQRRIAEMFTQRDKRDGESEYRHNISNLALLDSGKNAALSNYVFDAKRELIIDYDMQGKYIPVCTKMVFFKYYSPIDASLHFWGAADRKSYLEAMDKILKPYYSDDPSALSDDEGLYD